MSATLLRRPFSVPGALGRPQANAHVPFMATRYFVRPLGVKACRALRQRREEECRQHEELVNADKPCAAPSPPPSPSTLTTLTAACVSWLTAAGTAQAADLDAVVGSANMPHHSASLLDWMLMGLLVYWVTRVVMYYWQSARDQEQQGPGKAQGGGKAGSKAGGKDDEGLSGLSHAHVRSYMEMSDSSNPDVLELRNRALATAASYSVGVAVKEAQPRIRALLRDLLSASAAGSDAAAPLPRPRTADSDPVAQLVWEELAALQAAHAPAPLSRVWDGLSVAAHEAFVTRLVEVVAMRAAQEQIDSMVHVAREGAEGVHTDPTQTPGGPNSNSGGPSAHGKHGNGRDIRGGGAH